MSTLSPAKHGPTPPLSARESPTTAPATDDSVRGGASGGARPGQPAEAMEPMLAHRTYSSFAQVQDLQAAWNDLARRSGDVLCSYEWCDTWWRHFGDGRRLEIHTLHAAERLVAVLPLFRERLTAVAAGLRVVRLVGCDYTIDTAGLAVDPAYTEALLERVLDHLSRHEPWDLMQLGPFRGYVTLTEALGASAARHPQVQAVILGGCDRWLTQFDLPDSYERYVQSLPGGERRDTARRERKLRDGRDVQIAAVTSVQEVPAAMDALVALHQRLWTGRGMPGQFGDFAAVEQFHREIAARLAQTGELAMVTVRVDGQIVGAACGYHFGSRTHSMFRGYRHDAPWRSYAIGRLLHCSQVRQAIERGSTLLEDGRGVFDYKLRLNGHLRGERSLTIVRRGWTSRVRVWAGMRVAYAIHAIYARVWLDTVAPRLGLCRRTRHAYVRSSWLAQLFRRTRFGLVGGPALEQARRSAAPGPLGARS